MKIIGKVFKFIGIAFFILFAIGLVVSFFSDDSEENADKTTTNEEVTNKADSSSKSKALKVKNAKSAQKIAENFESDLIDALVNNDYSRIEKYFLTETHPDYKRAYLQIGEPFDKELSIIDEYGIDVAPFYAFAVDKEASDVSFKLVDFTIAETFEYIDGYHVSVDLQYEKDGSILSKYMSYDIYVDDDNKGYIINVHELIEPVVSEFFSHTGNEDYWVINYNNALRYNNLSLVDGQTSPNTDYYNELVAAMEQDAPALLVEAERIMVLPTLDYGRRVFMAEYLLTGEKQVVEYAVNTSEGLDSNILTRSIIETVPFEQLTEDEKKIIDRHTSEGLQMAELLVTSLYEALEFIVSHGEFGFVDHYIEPTSELNAHFKTALQNYATDEYLPVMQSVEIQDISYVGDTIEVKTVEKFQLDSARATPVQTFERTYKVQLRDNENGNFFGYYIIDMEGPLFE